MLVKEALDDYVERINCRYFVQWNLSVLTTSLIKFITCDLFSNVF